MGNSISMVLSFQLGSLAFLIQSQKISRRPKNAAKYFTSKMLAFQARDDLWMSVIPNNLWLVAHFVAQFPPAGAPTSIQLIQFNAIASSSSPMSHGDAKVFVKFGPARNISRPTSWRASSLEAQFSDFAFNWLNSSLSSWSKSSHLTFGSDKLSIRLSFLTRLCTLYPERGNNISRLFLHLPFPTPTNYAKLSLR